MGPKRKPPPTSQQDGSKRTKQNSNKRQKQSSISVDNQLTMGPLNIDYDLLAEAILKKQQVSTVTQPTQNVNTTQETPSIEDTGTNMNTIIQPRVETQTDATSSQTSTITEAPSTSQNYSNHFSSLLHELFAGSQSNSPMVKSSTNTSPVTDGVHLTSESLQLLVAAIAPSTRRAYLRSWTLLLSYCSNSDASFTFPCSPILISNFISHLHFQNLSASTITSHVSAISYVHKLCSVNDPTHHFVVRKILKGCQQLKTSPDTRMPITKPILLKLLSALQKTVSDNENIIMLRAIFLLAFHGFFRLGELVVQDKEHVTKVIQRADLTFVKDQGVQIRLRYFKHMKNNQPVTILLSSSKDFQICPVHALYLYTCTFNHKSGPLFSFKSGAPVSRSFVVSNLKSALTFCDLNPNLYKGHSFRIGAATEAARLGFSESYIQQLGRWHSNAVQRYIRINSFSL
ncbi:uncharacterized protein LOC134275823 [Saccostrea cucullata]|uniref:uncharacterized protein LOC134275823 n=1 Tax=Saccostrea cuccullata TaxID=36930 RepID=UPI002ED18CE1